MWDTHGMRPGRARVWFTGLVLASASAGCATQSSTAQALAIVGTAAVIVGAAMADGDDCYQGPQGTSGPEFYCSPGLSKGARKAGTGIAVAGVAAPAPEPEVAAPAAAVPSNSAAASSPAPTSPAPNGPAAPSPAPTRAGAAQPAPAPPR